MKKPIFLTFTCLFFYCLYGLLLLSLGTFDLKKQFFLSLLFQNMWENISHFSLAIDAGLMGREGFEVNGITTAYFLPFPSLIRGLLSILGYGDSAILSVLLGSVVFSCASLLIWFLLSPAYGSGAELKPNYRWAIGILLCTLLSPMLGMMSYPTVFWEAIVWASALFLLSCSLSILILKNNEAGKPSSALLLIFAFACGLTLFTRATFSFSACLLFGLTIIQLILSKWIYKVGLRENILSNIYLLPCSIIFGSMLGGLLVFNLAKWGSPFEFYPLQYYKMWDDAQLQRYLSHGALNLTRIPETFAYYFLPFADNFSTHPPFIALGDSGRFGISGAFDYKEPTMPLSITQPISVVLALLGVLCIAWKILKRQSNTLTYLLPAVVVSLVPILFILSIHSLSIRYAGDFLPAIMLLSLYCLSQFGPLKKHPPSSAKIHPPKISHLWCSSVLLAYLITVMASIYLSTAGVFLQNELWRNLFYFRLIPMEIGETIQFRNHGDNSKGIGYLRAGWSKELESFGIWSNANQATLFIMPPHNLRDDNYLTLSFRSLVTPNHPEQTIKIKLNGQLFQTLQITDNDPHEIRIEHLFRANLLNGGIRNIGNTTFYYLQRIIGTPIQEPIVLEFDVINPAIPKKLGISDDGRLLGIGLISATLH